MKLSNAKGLVWVCSGLCAAGAVSGIAMMRRPAAAKNAGPRLVYSPVGFGGYVPAPKANAAPVVSADRVLPALKAYQQGKYAEAETLAEAVTKRYQAASDPKEKRYAALAQWVDAYSAARRKDFYAARERFAYLRDMAAQLPDHGAQPSAPGDIAPTLEEEGAFQRAICTGSIDGPKASEAELDAFLRRYPKSILVQGAVKRIARYHKGDVPKDAEKLWAAAMAIQAKDEKARQRAASLCGPKCLAELLRRRGKQADTETLAREMKTDENGASLLALAQTAKKHGLKAQGLELTQAGLIQQTLPLIALVAPGHYVLVEAVTQAGTQVWDPPATGTGAGKRYTVDAAQWKRQWSGAALSIQ